MVFLRMAGSVAVPEDATDITAFARGLVTAGIADELTQDQFNGFIRKLRRRHSVLRVPRPRPHQGGEGRALPVLVELQGLDRPLHPLRLSAAGLADGAAAGALARASRTG